MAISLLSYCHDMKDKAQCVAGYIHRPSHYAGWAVALPRRRCMAFSRLDLSSPLLALCGLCRIGFEQAAETGDQKLATLA
jgi:hypothetical protein